MATKNKTTETDASVADFIATISDEKKRKDFEELVDLIKKSTRMEPRMWGPAIVGFGSYHYVYDSGREGDAPLTGLAARANAITLYLSSEFDKREELLAQFGKHKASKGCIYIRKLEDIDTGVLIKIVNSSKAAVKRKYPVGQQ
jgi:hypothetical protein